MSLLTAPIVSGAIDIIVIIIIIIIIIIITIIIITERPEVALSSDRKIGLDNGAVGFYCEASGAPGLTISWLKDRVPIPRGGHGRLLVINAPFGSILRIEPLDADADNGSVVTCQASTGIGHVAWTTANLTVYRDHEGELGSVQFGDSYLKKIIILEGALHKAQTTTARAPSSSSDSPC